MAAHFEARPLLFVLLLCLALCHIVVPSKISNLRLCADPECKDTISEANAIRGYHNDDPRFLSFSENEIISIKSKSAGRIPYLWSGEANGQEGYFPMSHVKEIKVFVRNPSHQVATGEPVEEPNKSPESTPEEVKEVDETEIEEDEPSNVKIEEKEDPTELFPEAERDETEIDEEEEVKPKTPEANQHINSKEESILQHVDHIRNAYEQINKNLHISDEKNAASTENEAKKEPKDEQNDPFSDKEPEFTETNHKTEIVEDPVPTPNSDVHEITQQIYSHQTDIIKDTIPTSHPEQAHHTHSQPPSDIIKDPMQTRHSDVLEQAHQTHSQESASQTRGHDDPASHFIEATPAATTFTSQSSYVVLDGTTIFDGVTPGSEAPQTATASRFTYEKPTEKVTRAFVETSVPERAASPESSMPVSINIDPSSSPFMATRSSSSNDFNPNSRHETFVKRTLTMHSDLENVPSRERQREDVSKSRHVDMRGDGLAGKTVPPPVKHHSLPGIGDKKENLTVPEIGSFMKVFEVYLKNILDMCPTALQNFLEQEPFGIPPTILLFYTICGVFFSLFFLIACTCLSNPSPKPRTDPVVIIRNLEEKLFITTKEKENLEDDIQSMKENVSKLKHNVELQKSSTGSVESDLQRQKMMNEELKEINDTISQQLENLKIESEEIRCLHEKNNKKLKILEEEKSNVTSEYEEICDKHQELTQSLATKEGENNELQSRVFTLMDQIQHLETRKQQLLEEGDEWTEKYRELTENWEQSQAEYIQMRETLDFKENELEQMKECFLQLKAFEEESEDASSDPEYLASKPSMQDKIQSMLDVSRVKAMLAAAEEEKNALQQSRKIEVECRLELEDQIQTLKRDAEIAQTNKAKAIRQNEEAQTKLSVLTAYFKEKEMQFQRELGEQEILKKQNINKLGTAEERAKCIESELESYKSQIEDLKQEIHKAERDFRAQIASNEKKAHENWLGTRAAERELKESRMECTILRQKLTELERRPMPGSIIRPLPTRGSGHMDMVNGPPLHPPTLHPPFPGDHSGGRKDLMPPSRDDPNKPPMKSPSPNFRPPRPSPPNFRPPPPMKKRGPPPPPDARDFLQPWQMPPPGQGPRLPFGNRPPPPPLSSKGNPRGPPPFGNHPPPMLRSLPDFSSLPEKHPPSKQHSQV